MINPANVSSKLNFPSMMKNGIAKTTGGIILCDMKKNVISPLRINPALKVKRDKAYAARVPNMMLIKLPDAVTNTLLKNGSTMSTPPCAGDFHRARQPSKLGSKSTHGM